jgi:hypothetical protein
MPRGDAEGAVSADDSCDDGLRVAPSQLVGAGEGLFTKRTWAAKDVVCRYTGDILDGRSAYDAAGSGDHIRTAYLMRLASGVSVDAGPHLGVKARYINDCTWPPAACPSSAATPGAGNARVNVKFVKRPTERCALVVALRDIDEGEEIFVSYGDAYWAKHGATCVPVPVPSLTDQRRFLVYWTVGVSRDYCHQLTAVCMRSVRRALSADVGARVDLALMCDAAFVPQLEGLPLPPHRVVVCDPNPDAEQTSKRKVEVRRLLRDCGASSTYACVLYLDSDIIVTGDGGRFEAMLTRDDLCEGVVYVAHDVGKPQPEKWCRKDWFGTGDYTAAEVEQFVRLGLTRPINAGQFMFRPTEAALRVFDMVGEEMRTHDALIARGGGKRPHGWEQAHLNRVLLRLDDGAHIDATVVGPLTKLFPERPVAGKSIYHFTGMHEALASKAARMSAMAAALGCGCGDDDDDDPVSATLHYQ